MQTVADKPYSIFNSIMNSTFCFAYFESPDEHMMKEYILHPSKRLKILSKVYVSPSIEHLGQLCIHNYFIIVLMKFDRQSGLVSISPKSQDVVRSDV